MIRLLQILGSILALAIGFHLLNWRKLIQSASQIDAQSLVIAMAFTVASIALLGLRWFYISSRITSAPAREQWRLYCLATFFNSFTPANIGGDLYRVVALRPWTAEQSIAGLLAGITIERILGLGAFLAGYLLALGAFISEGARGVPPILLYPALPAALVLLMMALLPSLRPSRFLPGRFRSGRIGIRLDEFERGAGSASGGRNLARLGGLSLLSWASWTATVFSVSSALKLGLPFAAVAMIVSLTEIIRLVPISFQGIGIREGVFSALAGLAGASPERGFVVAAVAYATLSLALALSGVVGAALGLVPSPRPAGESVEVSTPAKR